MYCGLYRDNYRLYFHCVCTAEWYASHNLILHVVPELVRRLPCPRDKVVTKICIKSAQTTVEWPEGMTAFQAEDE